MITSDVLNIQDNNQRHLNVDVKRQSKNILLNVNGNLVLDNEIIKIKKIKKTHLETILTTRQIA